MYKKYRDGEISRKLSILEKSISDKSVKFQKIFTGAISLILGGVAKVRTPWIF